jgi:hypothetical protein
MAHPETPDTTPASPSPAATARPPLRERLTTLLEEYGKVAFGVWAVIALAVFGGTALALHLGMDIESAKGSAGTFAGAYLVYQLTKPLRLAGVVVLTPLVARLLRHKPRSART